MRAFDETFRYLDELHSDENVDHYINSAYEADILHKEMISPHGLYYVVINNDLYDKYQQQKQQQVQYAQQEEEEEEEEEEERQEQQDLDSHPQHYIVAYLKLSWDSEQTEDEYKSFDNYLQLQRIYVRKTVQGRKIGLTLFHHTLAFAQNTTRGVVDKATFGTYGIEHYQTHPIAPAAITRAKTTAKTTAEQKDGQQQQPKFHKVWLTVYPPNVGPIKFYERCGFVKTGEYNFVINGLVTIDWVMTLEVNQ